jgi:hypothetical protein
MMKKFFLTLTILVATLISSVAEQSAYNWPAGAGRTTFSNANYTMVSTDRYVASTTTTFTASRMALPEQTMAEAAAGQCPPVQPAISAGQVRQV